MYLIVLWSATAAWCSGAAGGVSLDNLRPLLGALHDTLPLEGPESRAAPVSAADVEDVLRDGYQRAQELALRESEQTLRFRTPLQEQEQSTMFLFSFRRAEPEAKRASSCMGRSLLEASKIFMKRFNITAEDAAISLSRLNTAMDRENCRKLTPAGCEMPRSGPSCTAWHPYRTIDGTCNNLEHPKWGSAMTPFVRYLVPAYEDVAKSVNGASQAFDVKGIWEAGEDPSVGGCANPQMLDPRPRHTGVDSMRGAGRTGARALPSPRAVSTMLQGAEKRPPLPHVTLMVMQWGQFLDHDLVHTPESAGAIENNKTMPLTCCKDGKPYHDLYNAPKDCKPIDVSDDPLFGHYYNRTCMRFVRSLVASRGCLFGPREQFNQITAYIDASAVYGSRIDIAGNLRTFRAGRLVMTQGEGRGSGHLLPQAKCGHSDGFCFKAGDDRVNEQPGLTSMHTLWLRVHNHLARQLASFNPHWDDETIYQESRRVVSALVQQVTYREFLPVILGESRMLEYDLWLKQSGYSDSYDPQVDASIANVFATAAYRFGHSLVNDILKSAGETVPLLDNFMDPHLLLEKKTTTSALLEGLATSRSQALDSYLVPTLTNKLFASPHEPLGLDLMALNIQRGRDHGLPPYNDWRKACRLPPVTNFYELATVMAPEVAEGFKSVYQNVSEIDVFPAGLAEHAVPGGLLGPTFSCIIGQQFASLRQGDRFWYENRRQPKPFTAEQLASIRKLSLASLTCEHTSLEYLQPNLFLSANTTGNKQRRCATYPTLNAKLWKEEKKKPEPVSVCRGVGVWKILPGIDKWCTLNCLHHSVSFCPPTHCNCY
ncbi:LOW QUALITY PROTEIN: peroxidasin homolog [Penaeus chinensis]|uniref:LOW QUALITY PROTEIN: peroxidasin homolog n=1 Tax=Penaeus chinensis TaxID=139456 RepID=UPI001FB60265|nr:LOW QUALITY PROTEIN: peroxidasin homolog [Penaeus chinensis]